MMSNPGVSVLAIIFFVLQITVFVAGIYFLKNIYGSGVLAKDLITGAPYMKYQLDTMIWIVLIGMIVAWLWVFAFINNLGDYMISALICEDYFQTGGILSAICNTLIYHCGSVALASAVLFPCAIWRFLYGWIHDLITAPLDLTNPSQKTKIQTIFKFACICIEYPYKKFALRTGEHGFPMGYIASCNFCPATKEAYYLMRGYESVLGNMKIITLLFRIAGLVGIVALNAVIAQLVFTYLPYYQSTLNSPLAPTIVSFRLLFRQLPCSLY
jgi:Plasma-membrane choline transporter